MNGDQVEDYLSESNIFVLTSRWESFGLTALEAMSHGLPIVVSAVGGLLEIVNKDCGFLVKNKEELVVALKQLIDNSELSHNLGANGYGRVKQYFQLENMCEETLKVYYEVVDKTI